MRKPGETSDPYCIEPPKLRRVTTLRAPANYDPEEAWSPCDCFGDFAPLRTIKWIVNSSEFESCAGLLIMVNLVFIVLETDARSAITREADGSDDARHEDNILFFCILANRAFLGCYLIELCLRFLTMGGAFFKCKWNIFDLFLVSVGLVGEVLGVLLDARQTSSTSLLRSIRMVRLLRVSRAFIAFRDLYCLICGLASCVRTLAWAGILIFLTLTVFSIVAVEYVNPLMPAIEEQGLYDVTCEWCPRAFHSVMLSNLTFFQIVSGDGWSLLTRPIIERNSWTLFIFIAVIFMVCFGMLNLIIAAIVESAAVARTQDIQMMSEDMIIARREAWDVFQKLCIELDTDRSGDIGLEELREGMKTNPTLQNYFSVLAVEDDDLTRIFQLFDDDQSGDLSYREFHNELYKMKTLEVKTTLFYVMKYVQHMQRQMTKQERLLTDLSGIRNSVRAAPADQLYAAVPPATCRVPNPRAFAKKEEDNRCEAGFGTPPELVEQQEQKVNAFNMCEAGFGAPPELVEQQEQKVNAFLFRANATGQRATDSQQDVPERRGLPLAVDTPLGVACPDPETEAQEVAHQAAPAAPTALPGVSQDAVLSTGCMQDCSFWKEMNQSSVCLSERDIMADASCLVEQLDNHAISV